MYAAIDPDSKLLLKIDVYRRRGTDPAVAFLHRLTEKYDVADALVLLNGASYLTAMLRHTLRGERNSTERNHIETWLGTLTM